jgi:hypothetical protein
MKINKKTRILVSANIANELNTDWWNRLHICSILHEEFGLRYTSKRIGIRGIYFQPTDKQRFMLFIMKYGSYIKNRKS